MDANRQNRTNFLRRYVAHLSKFDDREGWHSIPAAVLTVASILGSPIVQIDRPTKRLLPGRLVNLYEWSLPVFVPKKSFISGIFPGFKQSGTKDLLLFGNISGPSTVWTSER